MRGLKELYFISIVLILTAVLSLGYALDADIAQDLLLKYEQNYALFKNFGSETVIERCNYTESGDVLTTSILQVKRLFAGDMFRDEFYPKVHAGTTGEIRKHEFQRGYDGEQVYSYYGDQKMGTIDTLKNSHIIPPESFIDLPSYFKKEIHYMVLLKCCVVDIKSSENGMVAVKFDLKMYHRIYEYLVDPRRAGLPLKVKRYHEDGRLLTELEVHDFWEVSPEGPWIAKSAQERKYAYTGSGEKYLKSLIKWRVKNFEFVDSVPKEQFVITFPKGIKIIDYIRHTDYITGDMQ